MSRCLDERALLRVLEREPAPRDESHLRTCADCRGRLHRLQDDLDRLTAALHGPMPVSAPAADPARWGLWPAALALAALAGLALLLRGGGDPTRPVIAAAAPALASTAGLGAALEGGGGWSDWTLSADGDEVTALRAALHGARPCAVDDRMLYAACDETALADWSPALEGEEAGR